jgi:glycosyltransferase involved in cell wall biosynthesis
MSEARNNSARGAGSISVNARYQVHQKTGMQRYAYEIASRFEGKVREIRPERALKGPAGHLWEQCYLPGLAADSLLWSPNNTGPVLTRHQVCTIHDIIPIEHPEWFSKPFAAWYKWLMPTLAKSAQHIIAVSEFTRTRVVEAFNVDAEKVSVVLNGIGSEFSPQSTEEIDRVRTQLGLPLNPYVLFVGSLEPRKNLLGLLAAWSVVQEKCRDVRLVVAGLNKGSTNVFSAVQMGKLPPGVVFTGYVPDADLPALYSGAMCFVYPSLYEGFGLPPLEAMACGTPVITSEGSSLSEVVGSAAILVDPHRPESIAEAILELGANKSLREELSREGSNRAKKFSWDNAAAETWQILCREAGRA